MEIDIETTQMNEIPKKPEILAVRYTRNDNSGWKINSNNHYDFVSFGKVLDSNNDLMPIDGLFNGSMSREKHIIHVVGGRRFIIKSMVR